MEIIGGFFVLFAVISRGRVFYRDAAPATEKAGTLAAIFKARRGKR